MCLDVADVSTSGRPLAIQASCVDRDRDQYWRMKPVAGGGYYSLVGAESGKCLDVGDAYARDGAKVYLSPCTGNVKQQWVMTEGSTTIVSRSSGKCLEVDDKTSGSLVRQFSCEGANSGRQQWMVQ